MLKVILLIQIVLSGLLSAHATKDQYIEGCNIYVEPAQPKTEVKQTIQCLECYFGFFLNKKDQNCLPCPRYCHNCNTVDTCTKDSCFEGYYWTQYTCKPCPPNCRNCTLSQEANQSKVVCQKCYTGWYYDKVIESCQRCLSGCSICSEPTNCDVCSDRYALRDNGEACKAFEKMSSKFSLIFLSIGLFFLAFNCLWYCVVMCCYRKQSLVVYTEQEKNRLFRIFNPVESLNIKV